MNQGKKKMRAVTEKASGLSSDLNIEVAAALIRQGDRYLVTQRQPRAHLALFWEFPGGKRESGETLEDCLKRELMEELGLTIEVGDLVDKASYEYPRRHVQISFYNCRILDGEPELRDCHDFRWLRASQMDEALFPPADAQIIRKIRERSASYFNEKKGP